MEELYHTGKVRASGVCNFDAALLMDLCWNADTRPMVNQIAVSYTHLLFPQKLRHIRPNRKLDRSSVFSQKHMAAPPLISYYSNRNNQIINFPTLLVNPLYRKNPLQNAAGF